MTEIFGTRQKYLNLPMPQLISTVDFTPKAIPFQHPNVDITLHIPFGLGAKAYINLANFITV